MFTTKDKLKIAVVTGNRGFCFFYRIKWPMMELHKKGLADIVAMDQKADNDAIAEACFWADILIFQHAAMPDLIEKYARFILDKKLPKLIVVEFDDDYTNLHPANKAYFAWGTKEIKTKKGDWVWKDGQKDFNIEENKKRLDKQFMGVSAADIITVTSDDLAEVFTPYNNNVYTLPNFIHPQTMDDFPKVKRDYEPVVIGWQGGASHYEDLWVTMPVLNDVKKRYKDKVIFKFMGADFSKLYSEVDGVFIPWAKPDDFFKAFYANSYDIGIVPLTNNDFNRRKSNIKWLEYSYYNIPSVVANLVPYKQHIEHNRTGMLYNNNSEMYRHLCELIEDPIKRAYIGRESRNEVVANFNIETHAYKWHNLYVEALNTKINIS